MISVINYVDAIVDVISTSYSHAGDAVKVERKTLKQQPVNNNMVNIQITRGACIIGATLLCCLCLFVALLIIISVILALVYFSGRVVDVHIMINVQLPEAHIKSLSTIFQNVNVVKEKARKLKANKLMDRDKTSTKSALIDFSKHRPNETIGPLILRVSNFTNKLNSNQQYYSKPFNAYEGGHKCV